MTPAKLPSLRALQVFESFGRTLSVAQTAQELGITSGAVSQQLKILEDQAGHPLISRQGRGLALRPEAVTYHQFLTEGFDALIRAQAFMDRLSDQTQLSVSALPSLLSHWLNPILSAFQDHHGGLSLRLESTHQEPERHLLSSTFRLTYGAASLTFPHRRELFCDHVFPVCAPAFLAANPTATDPHHLAQLPLLHTDWGPGHPDLPTWTDWFAQFNLKQADLHQSGVFSLSSLAIESAIEGKGVALAQSAFVAQALQSGRLIRLSSQKIPLPHPYFICWGEGAMQRAQAQSLLDWITTAARQSI